MFRLFACFSLLLGLTHCESTAKPEDVETTAATAPSAHPVQSPSASAMLPSGPVGMVDPFVAPGPDALKAMEQGYRAMHTRNYAAARAAFESVVAAHPDYSTARFETLRAAVLAHQFDAARGLWSALLMRDFAAYSGRLVQTRDFWPLRESPEWPKIQALEASIGAAYRAGLESGVVFVARGNAAAPLVLDAAGQAKLTLDQEVYHYDPLSGRYRRLTETGGQVVAVQRSPDRKQLALLTAAAVTRDTMTGKTLFHSAAGSVVDLDTLTRSGPYPLRGDIAEVQITFNRAGTAVWRTDRGDTYTADAGTGIIPSDLRIGSTVVTPDAIAAQPSVASDARSQDGRSWQLANHGRTVHVSVAIAADMVLQSPGHTNVLFAGPKGSGQKQLYLWSEGMASARRIASGTGAAVWLDESHLVYETGTGRRLRLHVLDASSGRDTLLAPRAGTGLFGYPVTSLLGAAPETVLQLAARHRPRA